MACPCPTGRSNGNLRLLLAVLNWGMRSRNEAGGLLHDSDPLKGLRCPGRRMDLPRFHGRIVNATAPGWAKPCADSEPRVLPILPWYRCVARCAHASARYDGFRIRAFGSRKSKCLR